MHLLADNLISHKNHSFIN